MKIIFKTIIQWIFSLHSNNVITLLLINWKNSARKLIHWHCHQYSFTFSGYWVGYQIHWTLYFCPWASLPLPKDKIEGGTCQLGVSARDVCASNGNSPRLVVSTPLCQEQLSHLPKPTVGRGDMLWPPQINSRASQNWVDTAELLLKELSHYLLPARHGLKRRRRKAFMPWGSVAQHWAEYSRLLKDQTTALLGPQRGDRGTVSDLCSHMCAIYKRHWLPLLSTYS